MIEAIHSVQTRLKKLLGESWLQEGLIIASLVLLLMLAGNIILESWRYFFATVIVIGALILMLVNLRIALLLFIVFLGAYEEFVLTSSEAFYTEGIQGSIIAVRILGIGLLDFCLLFFLIPVLIKAWYHWSSQGTHFFRPYDTLILPFVAIWLYGMVLGWFNMHSPSVFAADVRDLGYIIVFYYIVSRVLTVPRDYFYAIAALLGTIFIKTFMFAGRYFTGGGLNQGFDYLRPLIGSDTAQVGLVLAMTVATFFLLGFLDKRRRYGLLVLICYLTVILIAGLTRSTMLFTSGAIVILFFIFRKQMKPTTIVMSIGIILTGGFFFYFFMLSDTSRDLISYVLGSAFNWVEAIKVYGDMSMGQRILEFINIWETLQRSGAVFTGLGWGAAWSEVAIHHPLDKGAFPLEEQYSGVHTSAHIDAVQYLLKLGAIVMPLLYFSWLRIFTRGYQTLQILKDNLLKWTLIGCMMMLVIFGPNFIYFARLKFLLAVAIAGIAVITYYFQSNEQDSPGIADSNNA